MDELLNDLRDLGLAWREYLRYCFYSRRLRDFRRVMRRRLMTMLFFICLGAFLTFWLTKSIAYGQEELVLGAANLAPKVLSFFPLTLGSSLAAMFIHFARRRFGHFKRLFDFLVATVGLVLLSPLLLIVAILIKFDSPGPVFFGQERVGMNGRVFKLWKLRTMRHNAEIETGPVWAADDDPRITNLGNFLRKSHIDEIPQLFNVFKAEMSLIGPRPLLMAYLERYTQKQARRHEVKPGLTGWAQINGRNAICWEEKFNLDVWYVDHCSFWLDLKIFALTIWKIFKKEGISQPGHVTMKEFKGLG